MASDPGDGDPDRSGGPALRRRAEVVSPQDDGQSGVMDKLLPPDPGPGGRCEEF